MKNELTHVPNLEQELTNSGLAIKDAQALLKAYGMPIVEAGELLAAAETINVTNEADTEGMAKARETRLKLRSIRVDVKKKHDEIKEDVKKQAAAIDFVERTVRTIFEPVEERLLASEKFAEVAEANRKAARTAKRHEEMAKYTDNIAIYNVEDMADDAFDLVLQDLKAAHEARLAREAAEKAAAEQAEKERAAAAEKERQKRLATEKKLAAERAAHKAAEEKAQAERDKAAALQKEIDDRKAAEEAQKAADAAAEAKRIADEKAAEEAAAAAPDKEKLQNLVQTLIGTMAVNNKIDLTTEKGKAVLARIEKHYATSLETYQQLIEKEL